MIHMQRGELTVNQYAKQEQVDPRTVRRWIAKGALPVRRTTGGGVRIVVTRDVPRMVYLTPEGPR